MTTLKDILVEKMSEDEIALCMRSFDIIGDIAVLEIPDALRKKEKIIAAAIPKLYPFVKVVAKKVGATSGIERIRHVKVIAGEKRTETIYLENHCRLKLDINKVYFSPRLSYERMRVAEQVKSTDVVYDLFCGVGPYAIPCAKRAKSVLAVDINKWAIHYLLENMKLNKVSNIEAYTGDCRTVVMNAAHRRKADHVIMNLPMHAGEFLDVAFYVAKKGATIHYYCFIPADELYEGGLKMVRAAAKAAKRKIKVLVKRKCGQLAPRIWRTAIDFKVLN